MNIPDETVWAFAEGWAAVSGAIVIDDSENGEATGKHADAIRSGLRAATPLIAAQVLREAAVDARRCVECGKVHEPHKVPWRSPLMAPQWGDPVDGHAYAPASLAAAGWLGSQVDRLSRRSS